MNLNRYNVKNAFKTSITSVSIPKGNPRLRVTFVAPIFPEPFCLISIPLALASKKPVGIAPTQMLINA